jgi:hypothetical protein
VSVYPRPDIPLKTLLPTVPFTLDRDPTPSLPHPKNTRRRESPTMSTSLSTMSSPAPVPVPVSPGPSQVRALNLHSHPCLVESVAVCGPRSGCIWLSDLVGMGGL